MQPIEKSDGIVKRNRAKFTRLIKEAMCLTQSKRNTNHKALRMIEIIDDLSQHVAPVATCKTGCSHCCYMAVAVSTWEVQRIAEFSKRKTTVFTGYNPERNESISHIQDKYVNVVCPFLIDNLCTIYPVRPFMCRAHYAIQDDPYDCDILHRPNAVVPYFNFEEYKKAFVMIFLRDGYSFGDIREFFEDEK